MDIWQKLKRQWDRLLFFVCFFFLSVVIAFGVGFFVADRHKFPYFQIKLAVDSAICNYGLELSSLIFNEKYRKYPYVWVKTHEPKSGVVVNDPSGTYKGYTLIADGGTGASLIDMKGKVIHKWRKDFFDVWPLPDHVNLIDTNGKVLHPWHKPANFMWPQPLHVKPLMSSIPEDLIYWHKLFLFPNGDLIAIYTGPFTPYGAGIIKINSRSELIWKADINAHHDLTIADDGRIFVLTHKYNYDYSRPRIDDYITVLSPEGMVLDEISIYNAIRESPYYNLIPGEPFDDYLHTNNIDLLTSDKVNGFPFLSGGDMLLSHRNSVCMTVVDANTFKVKWALTGVAGVVHDADFLMDGKIAFFDNRAYLQGSAVVEWDCGLNKPIWEFTPADYYYGFSQPLPSYDIFASGTGGAQQKLPNGNYLIVNTNCGSMFEATPEKKVVWKYVSTKKQGNSIARLFFAERYSEGYLTFLTPSDQAASE